MANLNVHFHSILPDGVFAGGVPKDAPPVFVALAPPTDAEVEALLLQIARRSVPTSFAYRRAREFLGRAIVRATAADMALVESSARRRLGQLVGGDEGADLVREAEGWMRSQGVANPARTTELFAPGFDFD